MTATQVPHLPNEILYEIVSYVSEEDVLNLRLSDKTFHSITADRFAVTFFENRAYDMSIKGLEALVKISEQPTFARHIKTIVIGHGGKVYPGEHRDLLVQAFQNLANVGNTISLGLRQVRKCRNYRRRHHVILRHTFRFFRENVLAAAIRARMPLGEFVADLQSSSQNRTFHSVTDDWTLSIQRYFSSGAMGFNQFSGLRIKLGMTGSDSSSSGHIFVDKFDKRLEVSNAGTWAWQRHLQWGYTMNLRELVLEDCDTNGSYIYRLLVASGPTIQRLSLYDVRLRTTVYGQSESWMSLFAEPTISLHVLKFCKLGNLWDETNGCWLEGGDKTIEASTRAQVSTVLANLAAGICNFTLNG